MRTSSFLEAKPKAKTIQVQTLNIIGNQRAQSDFFWGL